MLNEQIASARNEGYSDDEILNHLKSTKPDMGAKIDAALKERYTPREILDHLAPPNASVGGNILGGAAQAGADIIKTGEKLGLVGKDTSKAADEFAKKMYGGRSGSERFFGNDTSVSSGFNAAAEGLAPMAMDLGAGAAGAAIGGSIGAAFGGVGAIPGAAIGGTLGSLAGYFGSDLARNYGRRLEAREAANNGQEAGLGDKALAVGASVPQALINRFQIGKALPGAAEVAEKGLAAAGKRVVGAAEAGAIGNVLGDTTEQFARNVGTENGQTDIEQTGKSALLGAAVGGGIRAAGEAKSVGQDKLNKRALKDFEHKDEVPNVANEFLKTADENGLNVKKTEEAAKALDILEKQNTTAREEANKVGSKAIELASRLGVEQDTITKARTALEGAEPNKSHVEALQKVMDVVKAAAPERAEGFQASVDLAKRAATIKQLMRQSNFTKDAQGNMNVSGGASGFLDRKTRGLLSLISKMTGVGAGVFGGLHYAGYAGLPVLSQAAATVGNAFGPAAVIAGGYGATRLVDKALNLRNPLKRFADAAATGETPPLPGGGEGVAGMNQRLQQMAEAKAMAEQAEKAKKAKAKEEQATKKGVEALMKEREKAYNFDEQKFVDKVEAQSNKQARQERSKAAEETRQKAAEAKAAKTAFEEIMGPRRAVQKANEERLAREDRETKLVMDQAAKADAAAAKKAKADEKEAAKKARADEKEAAKAAKAKQEGLKKAPIAPKPKDEPKSKNTDEPKKSTTGDDTPFVYGEKTSPIKDFKKYLDKTDTRSVTKVQAVKEFNTFDQVPKEVRDAMSHFVTKRSRESARQLIDSVAERYPEHAEAIRNHFDNGGTKSKDSVVNRVFKYTSDKAADNARARKSKDDK